MMGRGKTSYAIQMMNKADLKQKFIYVTPFLEEVQRIKNAVTTRDFKEPDERHGSGTKLESLKRLISAGEDIVTTHSLFGLADEELENLLEWEDYTLIVDEVMDVISEINLKKDDIQVMVNSGLIEIAFGTVFWTADKSVDTQYNIVRDFALAYNLYAVDNTALIWNFPADIFDKFNDVYILTYMFDGQIQRYYYDIQAVKYDYYDVISNNGRYALIPKDKIQEDRSHLKSLITIYDGELNEIGEKEHALSKSWFGNKNNAAKVKQLKNNLYNYFQNKTRAKSDDILWTTFKDYKNKLKGKGYSKEDKGDNGTGCFTAWNLRATNKYRNKTVLAFCLNRYLNPVYKSFFKRHGVTVNEDLLALSDLLQWIFRSAIRDGQPITIYVPSKRMRNLLKDWLDGKL